MGPFHPSVIQLLVLQVFVHSPVALLLTPAESVVRNFQGRPACPSLLYVIVWRSGNLLFFLTVIFPSFPLVGPGMTRRTFFSFSSPPLVQVYTYRLLMNPNVSPPSMKPQQTFPSPRSPSFHKLFSALFCLFVAFRWRSFSQFPPLLRDISSYTLSHWSMPG